MVDGIEGVENKVGVHLGTHGQHLQISGALLEFGLGAFRFDSLQGQILCCKITDDGIGRKKAAELKSKSAVTYKSMGLQITADRIALMHKEEHLTGNVVINDLVADGGGAAGTEVILKLPVRYAQSHIDRR